MTAAARELFPDLPMVTTCHGTDLRQYVNCPHLRERVASSVRKLDGVMALSGLQAREIGERLGIEREKIRVVGGGYDDTRFYPAEKPSAPPVELLYAGKFSASKGVPWLLSSLARIGKMPWRLHMAGSGTGEEAAACMALAGKLGGKVVVHGRLDHGALADLMRKCHIFVLASFFEGLPLVLLEALASGCRIVATSLPGTREVVGERGNPFVRLIDLPPLETVDQPFEADMPLLEERLSNALAEMIRKAQGTPGIDMEIASDVTRPYAWPAVFRRIGDTYEQAVRRRGNS